MRAPWNKPPPPQNGGYGGGYGYSGGYSQGGWGNGNPYGGRPVDGLVFSHAWHTDTVQNMRGTVTDIVDNGVTLPKDITNKFTPTK